MNWLNKNKIRAVTMYPETQSYSPAEWCCGEVYDALEKAGVLLILEAPEISYDAVAAVLEKHPKLNILYTYTHYGQTRYCYALLRRFPNLYLDTAHVRSHFAIEDMCRRYGANRILFGAGMPEYSPAVAVTLLTYAKISDDEKRMIARGNLERLLGGAHCG
jgi:predicted TIM-barrel fold metal-dependent hydrolase